jgi:hypothetical protein
MKFPLVGAVLSGGFLLFLFLTLKMITNEINKHLLTSLVRFFDVIYAGGDLSYYNMEGRRMKTANKK